jgi:uncharacterized membrane protein
MSLYLILKFIHVAAAIVAVGSNVTYAFWLRRAGNDPEQIRRALESVHVLDTRIANPGYIVLLLTGLGMALNVGMPLTTPWIAAALVLYVLVALLGIAVFSPTLRRQRELAADPTSDAYRRTAARGNALGMLVVSIVAVILGLMVFKPTF